MTHFVTPAPTDRWHVVGSPIGDLLLTGDGRALTGLHMHAAGAGAAAADPSWRRDPAAFAEAERQLRAYFEGELTAFDLELAPSGTGFQLDVWRALVDVPYGETASYGEIARQVGRPTAFRAVGAANGRNPIAVIVPCHRIIGSAGSLTGYGGGLDRKRLLLDLEAGLLTLLPRREAAAQAPRPRRRRHHTNATAPTAAPAAPASSSVSAVSHSPGASHSA